MAMLPLAPVRFSITTVQPCASCRPCATSRAEMSGVPPGGMVTSMRIGRDGYEVWACVAALISAATARAARPHVLPHVVLGLILVSEGRVATSYHRQKWTEIPASSGVPVALRRHAA